MNQNKKKSKLANYKLNMKESDFLPAPKRTNIL